MSAVLTPVVRYSVFRPNTRRKLQCLPSANVSVVPTSVVSYSLCHPNTRRQLSVIPTPAVSYSVCRPNTRRQLQCLSFQHRRQLQCLSFQHRRQLQCLSFQHSRQLQCIDPPPLSTTTTGPRNDLASHSCGDLSCSHSKFLALFCRRPDITVPVDWAYNTNLLIYYSAVKRQVAQTQTKNKRACRRSIGS